MIGSHLTGSFIEKKCELVTLHGTENRIVDYYIHMHQ